MKLDDLNKVVKIISLMEKTDSEKTESTNCNQGAIKIIILQRGWVAIGRFFRNDNDCILKDAYVIRTWGTTKGLGQLALEGKQSDTILDKAGTMEFDYLTVISTIVCKEGLWEQEL